MNTLEIFFLDLGLSWTLSKFLPYVLTILVGVILVIIIRRIDFKKKWSKNLILSVTFFCPFIVYFSFFPIYEGDFSNLGISPKSEVQFPKSKSLTVVVLPNCPYCYQSIRLMKKMKDRNPQISISYWVVTSDTLKANEAILEEIPSIFMKIQKHQVEEISSLVQGTFPCFILSDNQKVVKLWNNNQIGVCAFDEIENFFH